MPVQVVAALYIIVIILCLFKCVKNDVPGFFSLVPYIIYTEVFVRNSARFLPYLTLQYTFIACFLILLIANRAKNSNHFPGYILLALFTFLEIANNLAPDKPTLVRSIFVNSLALLLPVVWASYNVLKPVVINRLLNNIKIASIYLAGIVVVAHFTGNIQYGNASSSAASNGMAPVQLSGYLGVGCVMLFLSIMNVEEQKNRIVNICVLSVNAIVMILTFSRGGLYFVGAVVCLFILYNRHRMGQYVKLLVLLPIAIFIYSYVVNQTGGKIVERYEQEGTSNRDVLIQIGIKIFMDNPFIGVGTGNFNTTITREKLYGEESGVHNEFIRAGAEHGIIGLLFYWSFYLYLFVDIIRRRQPQKQYAMYFFALFCLIIVHNGLKISIQPMLLMLAVATPSYLPTKRKNVSYPKHTQQRLAQIS